jgi:uncharacterized protein YjiK
MCRNFYLLFLVPFILFLSCNKDNAKNDQMVKIASYTVSVSECSGLCWFGNDKLLTVSDSSGRVYIIDLNGNLLDSLSYQGDDCEGVAYNPATGEIFLVEEKDNKIIQLDSSGNKIADFLVNIDNTFPKHGLEGISYNSTDGHLYTVSEKDPGLLLELTVGGNEIHRTLLAFALDYSSVYVDQNQKLWILSDDSRSVTRCDLQGNIERSWQIEIKKGEGLVIDNKANLAYIVTDDVISRLYVFSF